MGTNNAANSSTALDVLILEQKRCEHIFLSTGIGKQYLILELCPRWNLKPLPVSRMIWVQLQSKLTAKAIFIPNYPTL